MRAAWAVNGFASVPDAASSTSHRLCAIVRRWAPHLVLNAVNDGEASSQPGAVSQAASRPLAHAILFRKCKQQACSSPRTHLKHCGCGRLYIVLHGEHSSVTSLPNQWWCLRQATSSSCTSKAATTARCSRATGATTTSHLATATSAPVSNASIAVFSVNLSRKSSPRTY